MSTQTNFRAISNNNIACVAWKYSEKIASCLGFSVTRIDLNSNQKVPLPAWVGFKSDSNENWTPKTTEQWPVQKFEWRDLTAKQDGFYQYQIVPMIGTPGQLTPRDDMAIKTNPVHLSSNRGDISAYFNQGILSTQSLARSLPEGPNGTPDCKVLLNRIDQPGDPLRESLAGQMNKALAILLNRARKEGGSCYSALYELSDPELEEQLIGSPFVHLILSNTGTDDSENAPARQALHESHTDVTDRMLPEGHIGHNKFTVYVDSNNVPQAVLTGSTNWTANGLCAQTNNSIIIESPDAAKVYFDYWNRIKSEGSVQSIGFRSQNNVPHELKVDAGETDVTLWFSPNTASESKTPKSAEPSDLAEVFEIMGKASQGILFLAFEPGTPSIIDQAATCQNNNPSLFIRGAVTDPKAVGDFNTHLFHRNGDKPDAIVIAATEIKDQIGFWHKELLKSSPTAHAIIHDKIVVVDPFSDTNCTVITGSHNLGYRASIMNDDNIVIMRGNRALAESYAAHVMDVYEHFRWRYTLQQQGATAWTWLATDDTWQDYYFAPNSPANKSFNFWFSPTS